MDISWVYTIVTVITPYGELVGKKDDYRTIGFGRNHV